MPSRLGMEISPQRLLFIEAWYPSGMLHTHSRKTFILWPTYMQHSWIQCLVEAISRLQVHPALHTSGYSGGKQSAYRHCISILISGNDLIRGSPLIIAVLRSKPSTYEPWEYSFIFKPWQNPWTRQCILSAWRSAEQPCSLLQIIMASTTKVTYQKLWHGCICLLVKPFCWRCEA